ncbi:alpha-D-ribose 1-methylphosphonate 5-triphosphate diphosphatase [Zavarzinia sp.]|uniref:alpha-D-ribose 1-methylphosphonate 5-triphosphate diphosphatase n=1 Tax=Zavarzinia sp. TaxID=2027920 RepID=UPI003BB4E3D9
MNSFGADTPMRVEIRGGRILWPDGTIEEGSLAIEGGKIAGPTRATGFCAHHVIDARGLLVLPGIVDLHGDAFERQIMPRPGVEVSLAVALQETDLQVVGNGITTAFHAITWSWEPGLRGREMAYRLRDTITTMKPRLAADTHIHLRHETFNLDAVDEIIEWLAEGSVRLLAFNDHTPEIHARINTPVRLQKYAERAQLSVEDFTALLRRVWERRGEVPDANRRLARAAATARIASASHDDESALMRQQFHGLGCGISEFPKTVEAAAKARDLGDPIVLGAPNVMRGGSHNGSIGATPMIEQGMCQILASDYYYPALLHAAFRLAREGVLPFHKAWALISANPASAAGMTDRGSIRPGARADFVLVDDEQPALPRVMATIVAGRPVFQATRQLAAGF